MFPLAKQTLTDEQKIHYTMRIMPEDQNTGGFYIALFKKNGDIDFNKVDDEIKENDSDGKKAFQKTKLNDGSKLGLILESLPIKVSETTEPMIIEKQKKGTYRVPNLHYLPFAEKYGQEWAAIRDMYGFDEVGQFYRRKSKKTSTLVQKDTIESS